MVHTRLRVLHVTECYAGGVSRAIDTRVMASPEFEHILLWSGDEAPGMSPQIKTIHFPSGILQRIATVKRVVRQEKPDIIHAHSSWAGVYTRVIKLGIPVVYEPHCFKFDDPGLSMALRWIFRGVEKMLTPRTAAFGALSAHERGLMRQLGREVPVVDVPNVPTLPEKPAESYVGQRSSMAMAGRLSRQKDPEFFLEVVNYLREIGDDIAPVWIGDGEDSYRTMLEAAGVRVTGWVGPEQLAQELRESVYVHSALYEGFPLSVLDAAAAGAPIVARRIPAFEGLPILQADDSKSVAMLIHSVRNREPKQNEALTGNQAILARYNLKQQALKLKQLYSTATHTNSHSTR